MVIPLPLTTQSFNFGVQIFLNLEWLLLPQMLLRDYLIYNNPKWMLLQRIYSGISHSKTWHLTDEWKRTEEKKSWYKTKAVKKKKLYEKITNKVRVRNDYVGEKRLPILSLSNILYVADIFKCRLTIASETSGFRINLSMTLLKELWWNS